MLVRADISRLPFASSSVDAVHAGAALHCWPSPSAAVSILFLFSGYYLIVSIEFFIPLWREMYFIIIVFFHLLLGCRNKPSPETWRGVHCYYLHCGWHSLIYSST